MRLCQTISVIYQYIAVQFRCDMVKPKHTKYQNIIVSRKQMVSSRVGESRQPLKKSIRHTVETINNQYIQQAAVVSNVHENTSTMR